MSDKKVIAVVGATGAQFRLFAFLDVPVASGLFKSGVEDRF